MRTPQNDVRATGEASRNAAIRRAGVPLGPCGAQGQRQPQYEREARL